MEKIEGLSIELDLDSLRLDRGLKGVKDNLKTVNSEMRANMSAFDRSDRSIKKYDTRLQGLNKKLEVQRKVTSEAHNEYEKMVDEYGEGSKESEKAAREYNKQASALNNLERYVDGATKELEEMRREQAFQESAWGKTTKRLEGFSDRMNRAGDTFTGVGRKMTTRVTAPIMGIGAAALTAGINFEESMSQVQAVSGATAEEMESLEEQARDMGETTRFSASEAAGGQEFLARAGFEANQIIAAMPGLLDMASASNMDLARASDIASNIISGFGMEAEEAGRVSDVLAKGAATANTNVEQLGGAMQYVAPVASTLGVSFEDVTAAVGHMSDAGIQGQQAGRQLRQGMLRLSGPTGKAAGLIEDLGISVFDAEGNMKDMPDVIDELNDGFQDMDADARAAALSTIFGSESTAGWSALLDRGADELKDYTGELENSEGAASDMADTMNDNAKGGIREMKSALEGAGIAASEHLLPAFSEIVDGSTDLIRKFGELDDSTQKNIIRIGLFTAAAGPASMALGGIFRATGALSGGLANVTRTIGKGEKGLVGALVGGLGKGGAIGLAIAGVGALGFGAYKLYEHLTEIEEANLDLAQSFSDQAVELDENADVFEKLSGKANASNKELAELNDLNKKISESSNPGEIDQLQQRYEKLAKNSGLSKGELEELFKANDNIIDQAPDVQTAVSETGNEFVTNTDAVREYVQSLRDMSEIELKGERAKLLEQQEGAMRSINEETEKLKRNEQDMLDLIDLQGVSKEKIQQEINEINEKINGGLVDEREQVELHERLELLAEARNDKIGETIGDIQEENETIKETIETEQEKIDKLTETEMQMANIYLQNVGINEEGAKGLIALDESIAKNDEEIIKLQEKLDKNGELTEEEQERLSALKETTTQQEAQRLKIFEELGLYNDINSILDTKYKKLSSEEQQLIKNHAKTAEINVEEGNIVKQIEDKNTELLKTRDQLVENLEKEGANKDEIGRQIDKIDIKLGKNDTVMEKILKEAGLWEDVKDEINKGTGAIDNQGSEIDENNNKTRTGIGLEEDRTREAGKSVDKKVTVDDQGTVDIINLKAERPFDKIITADDDGSIAELDREARSPVSKTINFIGKGLASLFAEGTPPQGHSGGHAILGDGVGSNAGSELVTLPNGNSFLSADTPTLYPDLPKGTHVIPARETKKIFKYADGTDGWDRLTDAGNSRGSEFMTLLALNGRQSNQQNQTTSSSTSATVDYMKNLLEATLQQNEILMQLLAKNPNIQIGDHEFKNYASNVVDEGLNELSDKRNRAWGGANA